LSGLWLGAFEAAALIATLIFTALATRAATRAARAADSAVEITREIGQLELRAYLSVSESLVAGLTTGSAPSAVVKIKNSGPTPAYIEASASYIGLYFFPKHGDMKYPPVPTSPSRHILGPGQELVMLPTLNLRLEDEHASGLREGKRVIFVYGFVTYSDIFKRQQQLKFRLMAGGPVALREGPLAWCGDGNEAT
jgi:hypothetical protein